MAGFISFIKEANLQKDKEKLIDHLDGFAIVAQHSQFKILVRILSKISFLNFARYEWLDFDVVAIHV